MKINEALKKYSLVPKRYEKKGNVSFIDTNKGRFVFKEKKPNKDILDYLKTRAFNYLPTMINNKMKTIK